MNTQEALFDYTLRLADTALVLGHRISEWCGHGPVLEQDIALTNIALDLVGQSRSLYQYAALQEGKGRTEDDMAYLRDAWDYRNTLLVEQPNGNFGNTIIRQFLFDAFNYPFHQALMHSKDETLAAIAGKSVKEIAYHLRFSSEWTIRLGDGTEESREKMQTALDNLWMFTGDMFEMTETDRVLLEKGIAVDLEQIRPLWEEKVRQVLAEATLQQPANGWMLKGGKTGRHTEHLGFILAELQFVQRAYPGMTW